MRFILIALTATFALPAAAQDKAGKFAYVDMQRAMREVEEGKKALASLEKMKKERQGKLDARQADLRKLQEDLQKQKSFMKPEVLAQKEGEFRQKLGELQQTYVELQKELAQEEAKLTKKIIERMGKILTKMGKDDGYTMIFEKSESGLLWAPEHLELTSELIRRYNKGEGK